jgi:hypothetical protein
MRQNCELRVIVEAVGGGQGRGGPLTADHCAVLWLAAHCLGGAQLTALWAVS